MRSDCSGAHSESPMSGCRFISSNSAAVSGPALQQHRIRNADLADIVQIAAAM